MEPCLTWLASYHLHILRHSILHTVPLRHSMACRIFGCQCRSTVMQLHTLASTDRCTTHTACILGSPTEKLGDLQQQAALRQEILCRWPGLTAQCLLNPSVITTSKGLLTVHQPGSRSAGLRLATARPHHHSPQPPQTVCGTLSSPKPPSTSSLLTLPCVMTQHPATAQHPLARPTPLPPAQCQLSTKPAQNPLSQQTVVSAPVMHLMTHT